MRDDDAQEGWVRVGEPLNSGEGEVVGVFYQEGQPEIEHDPAPLRFDFDATSADLA